METTNRAIMIMIRGSKSFPVSRPTSIIVDDYELHKHEPTY